jgi:hypothetical protein
MSTKKKTAPVKKVAPKKPVVKAKVAPTKTSTIKLTPSQAKLAAYLISQTKKGFGSADDKTGLSKKGQRLKNYIQQSHFDGYGPQVAGLISILLGEKIEVSDNRYRDPRFVKGACVVPLKNENSHNYPLNKVAVVGINNCSSLLKDADGVEYGNNIGNSEGALRPATEAEIKEFVSRRESSITEFLGIVLL